MVYRANPASGHGIATLHDRCVAIPCPALMTGVEMNTIASVRLVGWTDHRHLNFVCHEQSHAVSHTILAVLVDASSR